MGGLFSSIVLRESVPRLITKEILMVQIYFYLFLLLVVTIVPAVCFTQLVMDEIEIRKLKTIYNGEWERINDH